MKKIGVLTSGGDAPGMNAAIRAVVRYGIFNNINVVGIKNGFRGLVEGDSMEMSLSSVADIIHRGGTVLGSARSKDFQEKEGFERALKNVKYLGLDGIVTIGGDGTFKGAMELAKAGVPTIGIPGTIDNDLAYTQYTLGFFTALTTVLESVEKIRDTSSSHGRTNVIQVMGRNCGDIALYAGLAGGAEMVIIPEVDYNIDEVCDKIMQGRARGKKHSIIILAEGAGDAKDISELIEKKTGVGTRYSVLGYTQRGGTPSAFDRLMGSQMGAMAVELLTSSVSNRVLGIKGNEIFHMDIEEALSMEKKFDEKSYELTKILSI
ncbi:MAG: 6-phosphofructokinase [Sedimentibacter saalensis]|uniref:ATP-dependent 6-phosphofructokinase n=1 Tax=Sedimentibacter saalensis TaxID=130788 RepID=A0A562J8V6_9FIRM|nr:6-phosphofructokinase [Sedimentibacter saalensis]MEA5093426.1 6-phosphofructokinase [Sedimentibacter saalensis]TWH79315.1 6-phosphofructokinase [Sedimentibacter saalensis]